MSVQSATAISQRLSERVRAVPPSGIRKFFDVIATMPDVISLGVGEPDFTTPPQIIEEGVRSLRAGRTHYTSNYGTLELRRALASHLQRLYALDYNPESEICVTVGASEAVAAAMAALVDPGDEVVLHEPSYVAYLPSIIFNGGEPALVSTTAETDFALDPRAPRGGSHTAHQGALPGLSVQPDRRRAGRGDAARNRRYRRCATTCSWSATRSTTASFTAATATCPSHRCLACASERCIIGGFSKAYAMTGWRVGYVCAPRGPARGHRQGPPVRDHVGADHCPGCRRGGAQGRRAGRRADGRRVRPPAADVRRRPRSARPPDGRAEGRLLRLPVDPPDGPLERGIRRAAALRAARLPSCPATPSGRRARATCAPRWRRATSSSRRRSCASAASSSPLRG